MLLGALVASDALAWDGAAVWLCPFVGAAEDVEGCTVDAEPPRGGMLICVTGAFESVDAVCGAPARGGMLRCGGFTADPDAAAAEEFADFEEAVFAAGELEFWPLALFAGAEDELLLAESGVFEAGCAALALAFESGVEFDALEFESDDGVLCCAACVFI